MTRDEFFGWFEHHTACFPGVETWLDKVTSAGDNPPLRSKVLAVWGSILAEVDLDAAKRASLRMAAGEIEEPKGYDRHPGAIRKECGISRRDRDRQRPWERERYVDGQRVYCCATCRDTGLVRVWSAESMAAAKGGTLGEPLTLYAAYCACTCAAGDWRWRNGGSDNEKLARFNAERWLPCGMVLSEQAEQDRLHDWLATGQVRCIEAQPMPRVNPQKLLAAVGHPEEF